MYNVQCIRLMIVFALVLCCRLLVGVWRMVWSSGMSATRGVPTGERMAMLVS